MKEYIDGFLLTVPKDKLPQYKKMASKAARIWREHGALDYRECVGDDMEVKEMLPFPRLTKAKEDHVVILAYVVFESRKHRDATNRKIMADPRLASMADEAKKVFDCRRMAYGGFKTLVHV